MCVEENGSYIDGIVFDTSSRTLFWVDALKNIVAKMHVPLNSVPGNPVILHDLDQDSPRGIALDVCNRWAVYNVLTFSYPLNYSYSRNVNQLIEIINSIVQ